LTLTDIRRMPLHANNDYFTVGAVYGVPAMILYILLIISAVAGAAKYMRSELKLEQSRAVGYFASIVSFAVAGTAFQSPAVCLPLAVVFWATAGLARPAGTEMGETATQQLRTVAHSRIGAAAIAALIMVLFTYRFGVVPVMGEYHYRKAYIARNRVQPETGLMHVKKSIRWIPWYKFAWAVKGELEELSGDLDSAIESFREAVKRAPYDPMLNRSIGICYLDRKEWGPAEDSFREALRLHPTANTEIVPFLAMAVLGSGDTDRAISILLDTIRINQGDAMLYYALSGAYLSARRLDEARSAAEHAVWLAHGSATHRVRLAEVQLASGEIRQARHTLLKALELDPNNKSARRLFDRLTPLKP